MIQLVRTDSNNPDFQKLVAQLDAFLRILNGEEDDFYAQYNKTDTIKHAIVGYHGKTPVACGAIKQYEPGTMEVKRMFVLPEKRGGGAASALLAELEVWASEEGFTKCILETSVELVAAQNLYKKSGYNIIPNYEQYAGVENSVCFEKSLQ